mgnify:CR=1 FL=1|jgi:quercetin dioxygenase-like cupin family protein
MALIRNLADAEHQPVTAAGAEKCRMAVMVGKADGAPHFAVREIVVDPTGVTPRHSHDYEHEVVVLDGAGTFFFDGEERTLKPGDVVYVPAGHEHQFRADKESALRFLCMTPTASNCGESIPGT